MNLRRGEVQLDRVETSSPRWTTVSVSGTTPPTGGEPSSGLTLPATPAPLTTPLGRARQPSYLLLPHLLLPRTTTFLPAPPTLYSFIDSDTSS